MDQGFIDILKKVVTQHGKEYFLETKKCKAIVSDYTGSEYRIERGLLLRAVEAKVSNAIFSVDKADLDRCMKVQHRNLQEEQFMDSDKAWDVVKILVYILCDAVMEEIQTEIAAAASSAPEKGSKGGNKDFDEAVSLFWDEQYDKAMPIFEALAKENHAGAQTYMGNAYISGSGVKKNYTKAVEWYRKAADQGYAYAQDKLGDCYDNGWGVPADMTKAIEWFRKAEEQRKADMLADKGRSFDDAKTLYDKADAIYEEAENRKDEYDDKIKADKIYEKAVEIFKLLAENGHAESQYYLGECYYNLKGIRYPYSSGEYDKVRAKAFEWYRKAMDQGHLDAQYRLGTCYCNGIGVTKDTNKAIELWRPLADKGNRAAIMSILGAGGTWTPKQ